MGHFRAQPEGWTTNGVGYVVHASAWGFGGVAIACARSGPDSPTGQARGGLGDENHQNGSKSRIWGLKIAKNGSKRPEKAVLDRKWPSTVAKGYGGQVNSRKLATPRAWWA